MIGRIGKLGAISLVGIAGLGTAVPSAAETIDLTMGAFRITKEIVVAGAPNDVFDAFTGDVTPWWDHTFSEKPRKMFIEAKPGGGFWEIFDEAGNGVKHAEIIYAERGKVLRMRGPLGLSGNAIDMVHDFQFTAEGDSTRLRLVLNAAGQYEDGWKEVVAQAWDHFLVERFQAYVEGSLSAK